jgi:putative DNA primase/helicase
MGVPKPLRPEDLLDDDELVDAPEPEPAPEPVRRGPLEALTAAVMATDPDERRRAHEEAKAGRPGATGEPKDERQWFVPSTADDYFVGLLDQPAPTGLRGVVKYDHAKLQWHIWDGNRWAADRTNHVHELIRRCYNAWVTDERVTLGDLKHYGAILNGAKKDSVLRELASRPSFGMSGDEWDSNASFLGLDNGTLDLTTGKVRSGSPDDLISRSVGYSWDDKSQCPETLKFLQQVCADTDGNRRPTLEEYVLLMTAASLFGHVQVQQFYGFVGPGGGGKGTYCRVIVHVLGEYAATPAANLYTKPRFGSPDSSRPRADLLRLQGRRVAWLDEPPGPFDDEMLKNHSGATPIEARNLNSGKYSHWAPTHTIWFSSNNPPAVSDVGVSMRRRLRIVPFDRTFDARPDPDLEDKLKAEAPGILRLLASYAVKWYQQKDLLDLDRAPDPVKEASAAFLADNDPLAQFFADRVTYSRQARVPVGDLFNAWEKWALANGAEPGTQTGFGLKMRNRSGVTKSDGKVRIGTRTTYVYQGIGLQPERDDEPAETTTSDENDGPEGGSEDA